MHELAICQQLLSQVERLGRSHRAASVDHIVVSAGPLSGVEPQLLEQAFEVARTGTVAHDATLEIRTGPVRIRCRECGAAGEAVVNRILCEECKSWHVEVLEGFELMLMSVELSGLPANGAEEPRPERQTAATGASSHV